MEDTDIRANSTVVNNVFGILELAEKIFLECRIQDLLINCQRVSKQWQSVITSSRRLQQALFFEPVGGYDIGHFDTYFVDSWQNKDAWIWADEEDDWRAVEAQRRKAEGERVLVFTNPFFEKLHHKSQIEKYFAPSEYVEAANKDYDQRLLAMDSRNASWKRMLASQPPLRICYFNPLDDYGPPLVAGSYNITLEDTISTGEYHRPHPCLINEMVPVVYAKDVVRIDYKDGDYTFEKMQA